MLEAERDAGAVPLARRPAAHAEQAVLESILDGTWPAGGPLPAERELAGQLGVTRPTLREVLQRLHRDGWIEIRHGKPTRVRDVWREGGLNVLSALVRHGGSLPLALVPALLEVREALAPAYAGQAVRHRPREVQHLLEPVAALPDEALAFARFDWTLHQGLALASGNPIHVLILNGFAGFYETVAAGYFASAEGRRASRAFYAALGRAAADHDVAAATAVTTEAMKRSRALWASRPRRRRSPR